LSGNIDESASETPWFTPLRFVAVLGVWIAVVVLGGSALGPISIAQTFLLIFVGFLALVELASPPDLDVAPRWWTWLQWLTLIGVAATSFFLVRELLFTVLG
jgi:hypothetical protein